VDGFGVDASEIVVAGTMSVESVAVLEAEPPPDTLTELVSGEVAFAVTFTVTVIGG
jgi:hypothetical protein